MVILWEQCCCVNHNESPYLELSFPIVITTNAYQLCRFPRVHEWEMVTEKKAIINKNAMHVISWNPRAAGKAINNSSSANILSAIPRVPYLVNFCSYLWIKYIDSRIRLIATLGLHSRIDYEELTFVANFVGLLGPITEPACFYCHSSTERPT